jgi:hypothetical protein
MLTDVDSEMRAEAALYAAQASRRVAVGATRMPRWFPELAGLTYALGFGLLASTWGRLSAWRRARARQDR